MDDVRREIQPLIPQLQHDAPNEEEFNRQLEQLQDNVIQQLIDKVLIIKDFHKDDKKHIPESYIDSYIADQLSDQVRQRSLQVPRLPALPRPDDEGVPHGDVRTTSSTTTWSSSSASPTTW